MQNLVYLKKKITDGADFLHKCSSFKFQVQVSSLLRKIEKIQNMMYHCSQLAIAIRGEQWLDTK